MKKIFLLCVASSVLFLAACGGKEEASASKEADVGSKKGAWSDDDKDKFKTKCNTEIGKVLGESFCDCLTTKMEKEYEGFEDADKNINGAAGEKMAGECAAEMMKDIKMPKMPDTGGGDASSEGN